MGKLSGRIKKKIYTNKRIKFVNWTYYHDIPNDVIKLNF